MYKKFMYDENRMFVDDSSIVCTFRNVICYDTKFYTGEISPNTEPLLQSYDVFNDNIKIRIDKKSMLDLSYYSKYLCYPLRVQVRTKLC